MTDETLLTLRQLADELKLPESTVRYYRDAFLDHIPSVGTGRRRRYPAAAVAVLRSIARSYAAGRGRAEIIAAVHAQGSPAQTVTLSPDKPQSVPLEEVSNLDLLAAILDGEREQRDALWQMAKEIVRLTEVLEGQDSVLSEIADRAGVIVSNTSRVSRSAPPMAALASAEPATAPAPAPSGVSDPAPVAFSDAPIAAAFFSSPPAASPPPFSAPLASIPEAAEPSPTAAEVEVEVEVEVQAPPAPRHFSGAPDMDGLRAELEAERALVERLRESKLQLEHRAADAEAELEDRGKRRGSVISRLLGSQPDR
jgi:DNA-binding transcriptional MerR regulator